MRKIITLCLFAFALFLGTQSAVAQNSKLEKNTELNSIINAKAVQKTESLAKMIELEKEQLDDVYDVVRTYTYDSYMIHQTKNEDNREAIAAVEAQFESGMEEVLTPTQYKRYKTLVNH